jgi:hypothetical protein
MSIPVLLSQRTGQYHFALEDGSPICCAELNSTDQWMSGAVASIVNDALCPTCAQARQYFPELQNQAEQTPGRYVYIIWQAGSHFYKIGIARDPEKRFNQIQSTNPNYLQLLWYSELLESGWAGEIEKRIHREYQRARCGQPGQREWFNLGSHEVDNIRTSITAEIDSVC